VADSKRVRRDALVGLWLGASLFLLACGAAYYEMPREEGQSNYLAWAARVTQENILEAPGMWLLRCCYGQDALDGMSLNRKLPARLGTGLFLAALLGASIGAGAGALRRPAGEETSPGDARSWASVAVVLALVSPFVIGHLTGFLAGVLARIALRRADPGDLPLRRRARAAVILGLAGEFLFCWVLALDRVPGWSVEGPPGLLRYLPWPW
jgi:hypothetical protein